MLPRLDRGDRRVLIGAALALAVASVLALFVRPVRDEKPFAPATTYSASHRGAKAAYLLLRDLGYPAERWERPPTELPHLDERARETLLILADPVVPASNDERRAIDDFLSRGGTVLVAGDPDSLIPRAGTRESSPSVEGESEFRPVLPDPLASGVERIVMNAPRRWETDADSISPVFEDEDGAVVISYPHGQGLVIWWAASEPLTNGRLLEAGHLNLFLDAVAPASRRRILWDEYFHGFRGSLWGYFAKTPVPGALLQLALVFVAAIFAFGRRSGPVRTPQPRPRVSPLEFVATLGGLYHRAHAAGAAVKVAHQRFRYRVARRLGISPGTSAEHIAEALASRVGWKRPGFRETLRHCELAGDDPDLSDEGALVLVQTLGQYGRSLGLEEGNGEHLAHGRP